MCMFAVVIFAAVQEKQGSTRLGLLNTYKSLFSLDDSLAEIKTIDDLFEYLRLVSSQSRLIQPTSSEYFIETSGELKILKGVHSFDRPEPIEVAALVPRIDSPAFSFMAWVKLPEGGGASIVRKPLGKTPALRGLSCWSWYVGEPADRVTFGAHDCGRRDEELEEVVVSKGSSKVADGDLHNVALVVSSTEVKFFTDAVLQSSHPLVRPITDCSGLELEIGDTQVPTLGEVTFYARALSAEEMDEIMVSGFTLQSIAAGKLPFAPEETSWDDATSTTKQAFADAQSERQRADKSLQVEGALTRQALAQIGTPPAVAPPLPKIDVSPQEQCGSIAALGADTSCHIMALEEEDGELDAVTSKEFFALIQAEYFPTRPDGTQVGALDGMYLNHSFPTQHLRYAC